MEVAAGGTGGDPVRSRTRLNIALYVLVFLCVVAISLAGTWMWSAHEDDGGDTSDGGVGRFFDVMLDRRSDGATSLVGTDVGPGRVQAVRPASAEEQERWAAIIDAATGMATAFLNVDYRSLDETKEAVLARATGAFEQQYQKSFDGLMTLTQRAESVQTGEVVWAGISSADQDSATVFLATDGDVVNNTVDAPQGRLYRLQIELVLEDGEWLTRDLRFLEAEE